MDFLDIDWLVRMVRCVREIWHISQFRTCSFICFFMFFQMYLSDISRVVAPIPRWLRPWIRSIISFTSSVSCDGRTILSSRLIIPYWSYVMNSSTCIPCCACLIRSILVDCTSWSGLVSSDSVMMILTFAFTSRCYVRFLSCSWGFFGFRFLRIITLLH